MVAPAGRRVSQGLSPIGSAGCCSMVVASWSILETARFWSVALPLQESSDRDMCTEVLLPHSGRDCSGESNDIGSY